MHERYHTGRTRFVSQEGRREEVVALGRVGGQGVVLVQRSWCGTTRDLVDCTERVLTTDFEDAGRGRPEPRVWEAEASPSIILKNWSMLMA